MNAEDYLFNPRTGCAHGALRMRTVTGSLLAARDAWGERLAIVDGKTRLSWAELVHQVDALAAGLEARHGIRPGDVVALGLPNTLPFVLGHFALARLRAVTLPVPLAYGPGERAELLARTRAVASFFAKDVADGAFAKLSRDFMGRRPRPRACSPNDPFVLLATSGTEAARPKVCMHTHAGLLANAAQVAEDGRVSPDDRLLSVARYTHLFGLSSLHVALVAGATIVLPGAYSPGAFMDALAKNGATLAWAVPAQLADLVALADESGPRVSGQAPLALREVRTGGATLHASLALRLRAGIARAVIVQWGMSEIGGGAMTAHDDPPEASATSVGRPFAGADVRIVDAEDRPVRPGETGRLLYRRADMFRGYWDDPAATRAAVTADGWLRTGDLAALDPASGRLLYRGRTKDVINRGGVKVSAHEIEYHLAAMPGVIELAVVSVPDERLGERVCAVFSLRPGCAVDLPAMQHFLGERGVAKYKWPEALVTFECMPHTASGKVHKAAIRELVWRSRGGDAASPVAAYEQETA